MFTKFTADNNLLLGTILATSAITGNDSVFCTAFYFFILISILYSRSNTNAKLV